jgi:hypothetical protein
MSTSENGFLEANVLKGPSPKINAIFGGRLLTFTISVNVHEALQRACIQSTYIRPVEMSSFESELVV